MNLKKLFVEETDSTFIQFFRYCFVGGFATVVDWGLSALLFYCVFGTNKVRSILNAKKENGQFIGNSAPFGYLKIQKLTTGCWSFFPLQPLAWWDF